MESLYFRLYPQVLWPHLVNQPNQNGPSEAHVDIANTQSSFLNFMKTSSLPSPGMFPSSLQKALCWQRPPPWITCVPVQLDLTGKKGHKYF